MKLPVRVFVWAAYGICAVFLLALCVTGTVLSRERDGRREEELYYRELERGLVKDTRSFLAEAGFEDSGVKLTGTVDGDGMRSYTLTVHHRRIDRLGEEEREELRRELDSLTFVSEKCVFCHEFLILN